MFQINLNKNSSYLFSNLSCMMLKQ